VAIYVWVIFLHDPCDAKSDILFLVCVADAILMYHERSRFLNHRSPMILTFDDTDISLICTEILGQRPKAGLAVETQNGSAAVFSSGQLKASFALPSAAPSTDFRDQVSGLFT
jgi:hypothetical protein